MSINKESHQREVFTEWPIRLALRIGINKHYIESIWFKTKDSKTSLSIDMWTSCQKKEQNFNLEVKSSQAKDHYIPWTYITIIRESRENVKVLRETLSTFCRLSWFLVHTKFHFLHNKPTHISPIPITLPPGLVMVNADTCTRSDKFGAGESCGKMQRVSRY